MSTILSKQCAKFIAAASVALLFLINTVTAQINSDYSQYMDNLTPVNPAYSLLDKSGSINSIVRKQFTGIPGAPTTVLFNANLPVESIGGVLGLIVKNDGIGNQNLTDINAFFAKSVQLTEENFLSVSLNAGIRRFVVDNTSISSGYDPAYPYDVRETRPNLGFGVMFYSSNYYIGLSLPSLTIKTLGNSETETTTNFKSTYYLTGAYLATLNDDMKFKPATLIAVTNGEPVRTNLSGTIYLKDVLGLGANYLRNGDGNQFAGIVSFNFNTVRLGYSYQFSGASGLGVYNSAIHEVTLNYRFGKVTGPKLL
ncbi:MAG: PorP/SprF family type IX secretion system membrane protein [Mucilaginibacter sp.]